MRAQSSPKCYADGGLVQRARGAINRLVGNNPKAMEQRGRDPDAIGLDKPMESSNSAPAAPMATNPGYKSGIPTKDNPAGIRFAKGGAVRGPGTGTSDSVPIMASHGEYVLKAKAVKAIGVKALDALNAIADKPGDKPTAKKPAARGAVRKMAGGGLIEELPQFQRPVPGAGAMLEAQMNPTSQAMVANARTAPPLSVAPVPSSGPTTSLGATGYTPQPRQPYNLVTQVMDAQRAPQLTTSPGAAAPTNAVKFATPPDPIVATTAPGATPQAPRVPAGPAVALDAGGPGAIRNPNVAPGILSAEGAAASQAISQQAAAQRAAAQAAAAAPAAATAAPAAATAAPQAATAAPPAAAAPAQPSAATNAMRRVVGGATRVLAPLGVATEVVNTGQVALDPNKTAIDTATQAAQGASRVAAGVAGAKGGAALGALAGPLAPVAVPLGALAGGVAGYVGADKLIEAGRRLVGVDPAQPVATAAPVATSVAAAPSVPAAAGTAQAPVPVPAGATRPAAPPPVAPPAADPAAPPAPTNIQRVGNSYSGPANIQGDITVNGAAPRGGVSVVPGGGFAGGGGLGQSGADQALFAARMGAIRRGDVESVKASYGGEFGPKVDPVAALMNNGKPMTAKKAAAIAALQREQREGADSQATRARGAIDTQRAGIELKAAQALLAAQQKLTNAKTAAERLEATDNLRALQGKYEKEFPNKFTVVPGGQEIGPDGSTLITRPARVLDNQTGRFVDQDASAQALPPGLKVGAPTKQPDGTYTAGGKTVVIQGGKVTEIK